MAVQRSRHAAEVRPVPTTLGRYAGTETPHRFRSYVTGLGGASCGECFGWFDDPRHLPVATARGFEVFGRKPARRAA